MNILIACEESQTVCIEMRKLGHRCFSCDIQECSGGHPEWHIKGDVLPLLNGNCTFQTMDGTTHTQPGKWDLIIAHPPCTYLSCAGAERTFRKDGIIFDLQRYACGIEAAAFFRKVLAADCEHIAVENPRIMRHKFNIPAPTQSIQPFEFGEPWHKLTCFWLKGLEPLQPTKIVEPTGYWVQRSGRRAKGHAGGHRDPKLRAKTFPGIAKAMAEQWAGPIQGEKVEQ